MFCPGCFGEVKQRMGEEEFILIPSWVLLLNVYSPNKFQ